MPAGKMRTIIATSGATGIATPLGRAWSKFLPFPGVVLVAYLIGGIVYNTWLPGLMLVFLIPAYYMVGSLIDRHKPLTFLSSIYPIACAGMVLLHDLFLQPSASRLGNFPYDPRGRSDSPLDSQVLTRAQGALRPDAGPGGNGLAARLSCGTLASRRVHLANA